MKDIKQFTTKQLAEFEAKRVEYSQYRKEHSEKYFTKRVYKQPLGDIPNGGFNGA